MDVIATIGTIARPEGSTPGPPVVGASVGLYRGLEHLGDSGAVIPGGEGVAHLFIVGTTGRRAQRETFTEREGLLMGMHPSLTRRLKRLERMGATPDASRRGSGSA